MAELTPAQKLSAAENALHALTTGSQAVSVKEADGRQVTYTAANRKDLEAYIAGLRASIKRRPRAIAVRF